MTASTHVESVYWVFTQVCNDQCAHCYNFSGPRGDKLSLEDCLKIVGNLPESMDRLILSGGEPLAEREKLYTILDAVTARYGKAVQIMLQTNGDLLNEERLDTLIAKGVSRFDIASIDRYHKHAGERLELLSELFTSRGISGDDKDPLVAKENYLKPTALSWGYWGATEDMWLGGNWPRGRAMKNKIWKRDGDHNFCAITSGAKGFLGGREDALQEVSIQLWRINPCCPGTLRPLGDARNEPVTEALKRVAGDPVFHQLNAGNPYGMGQHLGLSEDYGRQRARELGNVCLWCDEFFANHAPNLLEACSAHGSTIEDQKSAS